MNQLPMAIRSRRYFLVAMALALAAGYGYQHATDEMAQLLCGAVTLTCLLGGVQLLRLARQADRVIHLEIVQRIKEHYQTVPYLPAPEPLIGRPSRSQVNQVLREIERQERIR